MNERFASMFFFLFSYISIQFSFKHKNLRQTTRKLLAYTKMFGMYFLLKKILYFSIFCTHAHTQRKSEEEKRHKKTFKILKNTICYFVLINILKHFIIFSRDIHSYFCILFYFTYKNIHIPIYMYIFFLFLFLFLYNE